MTITRGATGSSDAKWLADEIEKKGLCSICDHTDFYGGRYENAINPPTENLARELIVKALRSYIASETRGK